MTDRVIADGLSTGPQPGRADVDELVVSLCSRLIAFDTTNRGNGDAEGEREAAEFVAAQLADAGVEATLLERSPRRTNVLARIAGSDPTLPAVLVQGHLDVVPAEASEWSFAPFSGEVRDGYVLGRGATDMKDTVASVLTTVHRWAAEGRQPRRDVVLAFVADEEDKGEDGAHWLVERHRDYFTGIAAAIGESGGFTHNVGDLHLYPVGAAERGTAHLRLTAKGRAGHASRPNDENAVTRLIGALHRIAEHRWPVALTPAVTAFIEGTGAALGVEVDLSGEDAVEQTLARLGAAASLAEATVRPSATPTVLHAGYKVNVIPGQAVAEVDVRTLPGTEAAVLAQLDRLLGPGVEREFLTCQEAVSAPIDSPWFAALADALRAEDPAAVVVPYCMGGGTDAKAFAPLGIDCYGFAPVFVPPGYPYRAMAHGVDERIPVAGLRFADRVLDRFLSTC
ncbi:MAG TPA: M20/M25/M40 family metallo-hydrolase [Pseudonocardiaceae bacterium]|nr:M20/M25/M40 family metallo-hydrolase [Pseudonocardiaceae bacterium]